MVFLTCRSGGRKADLGVECPCNSPNDAAAAYWTIMRPDSRPAFSAKNGRIARRSGSNIWSIRRSLIEESSNKPRLIASDTNPSTSPWKFRETTSCEPGCSGSGKINGLSVEELSSIATVSASDLNVS